MSSCCLHARKPGGALAPLGNSIVDYPLVQVIPHFHQALLQILYTMDCYLLGLASSSTLYGRQDKSGLLGGHNVGEIKSGVSLVSSSMVSLALWAGALSC